MKQTQYIYGIHAVKHYLQHLPEDALEIWIQDNRKKDQAMSDIIKQATLHSVPIHTASRQTLDELTRHARHQGIVIRGRVAMQARDLSGFIKSVDNNSLFLVLDGIQDPHNLGACIRTADAAGVTALVIPKDKSVQLNATARKVASGGAEHVPVISVTNLSRSLREMQQAGVWVIGTADDAEESLYDIDLKGPLAIVLGAEGKGLRQNTAKNCDKRVSIPMRGIVESLNVSVAAGVCLYEALRQRQKSQ